MFKQLLPFFMVAALTCLGGETVLRGTLRLQDGPFVEGQVTYWPGWQQVPTDIQKVTIGPEGSFVIPIQVPETYKLIFSHPGSQPHGILLEMEGKCEKEILVTLDRYAAPAKGFAVVFERDGFDSSKQVPMLEKEGVYYLEQKSEREWERYQVTGLNRTMQGQDPVVDVDLSGDYISEASVVNGVVSIRFDPTKAHFRMGESKATVENVHGTLLPLAIARLEAAVNDSAHVIRQKGRNKDFDLGGLEELVSEINILIAAQENEIDSLILNAMAHRYLGRFTDSYDKTEDLRQAYELNPEILIRLPLGDVFNLIIGNRKVRAEAKTLKALEKRSAILREYLAKDISPAKKLETMYYLGTMYQDVDPAEQNKWLRKAIDDYPNSYTASNSKDILRQIKQVGHLAPNFAIDDHTGKRVRLSDFRGKYVLLNFWASWCGPCIREIPNLADVYAQIDRSQVEFVSVCLDKKKGNLAGLAKKNKMLWTQVGTQGSFRSEIAQLYSISYLPNVLLIDPDGMIVVQNTGLHGPGLLSILNQHLE